MPELGYGAWASAEPDHTTANDDNAHRSPASPGRPRIRMAATIAREALGVRWVERAALALVIAEAAGAPRQAFVT
jgi:hypothetical protein